MNSKLLAIVFLTLFTIGLIQSQTVEEKINILLEKRDILELSNYYPTVKDSIQQSTDMLCRTFIAIAHNRPEESCALMAEMAQKYPEQLGSVNMINLWAQELYKIGEYQSASYLLKDVLDQMRTQNVPNEYMVGLNELWKINNSLSNSGKFNIIGDRSEYRIPITRKKNDTYIYSEVELNGKLCEAFYDTGSGITVVSEWFAKENDITILTDSMMITNGLKNIDSNNKLGIIDTLTIGGFKCCNVPCFITPEEKKEEEIQSDILIGLDILRHFSQIKIYPQKNELLLTQNKSVKAKQHNYMLWGQISYIECMYNNERQVFILDTGNNHEGIYRPYYFEQYKHRFINLEKPYKVLGSLRIYQLKPFNLTFGNITKSMTDFFLFENNDLAFTMDNKEFPNGNIGVNFINQFDEVILDFYNMHYEAK